MPSSFLTSDRQELGFVFQRLGQELAFVFQLQVSQMVTMPFDDFCCLTSSATSYSMMTRR
jgi:hypothetical protein